LTIYHSSGFLSNIFLPPLSENGGSCYKYVEGGFPPPDSCLKIIKRQNLEAWANERALFFSPGRPVGKPFLAGSGGFVFGVPYGRLRVHLGKAGRF
jgi:hypothetical protein